MVHLVDSVGEGGRNYTIDVLRVQILLKSKGYTIPPGRGICGTATIAAIKKFQAAFMSQPTGLIEPHSVSLQKLTDESHAIYEWSGDSSQWSQDKKLKSLAPDLRGKVVFIIDKLRRDGFCPSIYYGWRSVAVQLVLHSSGRSKVKFSFHNAQLIDGTPNSYAADIIDSRFGWTNQAEIMGFWSALGNTAKSQGLIWGGDWSSFPDVAHVQLVPNSLLRTVKQESGL
ncbi:M15 family metallopeptidase [Geomonas subterranea]|uniref:M15 family metallopeptidase n=1 Tax=Geomonas subterranea TaxID=2847989 RepID=A0ABX8LG69_9BACT|nr:M15 family metallopeptidase [Geomonas subterranea]QXE89228.1 M15 family metallopeptidase [Geomonas subterranea]QXM08660.1 M15 family metallopeptidase [Geomonas subterranea]